MVGNHAASLVLGTISWWLGIPENTQEIHLALIYIVCFLMIMGQMGQMGGSKRLHIRYIFSFVWFVTFGQSILMERNIENVHEIYLKSFGYCNKFIMSTFS